jgi:hypothetical protein
MSPLLPELRRPQQQTRRLIMQKARYHSLCCSNSLFAHGFRFYFTPLTAVLFTFPSRYLFTFGHMLVFSLAGWSPLLHARLLVYRTTQDTGPLVRQTLQGYHLVSRCFPAASRPTYLIVASPSTPRDESLGLGCSRFVRHYYRNRVCFLFLALLRCFTSGGIATTLSSSRQLYCQVIPLGNL